MANKKNFWYVLVMTDGGPVFVTKVEYQGKTAYWNKDEKPLEMGMYQAKDLTFGLNVNGHSSYAVCQPFEIDHQPYNYADWKIKWEEKSKEEEE